MTDLEQIAKGLTRAQRKVVLSIEGDPVLPGLKTFSANAAFNLIGKGVTRLEFDRKVMRDRYALTPLGLALRNHLLQKEQGR